MTSDKLPQAERLEEMKNQFEAERARHGYSIDDPVDPVKNKSGPGRVVGSIILMAFITAVVTVVVAVLGSYNSGAPINLFSFLG